ncbi:alginate lyase family protein [Methyloceanibacter sp.]|uniref:alginate lyase family protein n=1 Tax=Methyloceanibacter sp. TaxID=1965321 RepID=UPI002D718CD4|nr:alginate lyase family protein [Methyloceanibacter sp.]HZP07719.1 alginate lyase family protein [Methyloceanibacter sp.]
MTAAGVARPSRLDRATWYYRRLRAMDGAEVAHRLGEAVKRRVSRLERAGWAAFDRGDGPLPALTPLDGALAAMPPGLLAALRDAARSATSEGMSLLGQTWRGARGTARFHLDPPTGGYWPREAYCFDIDYRTERRLGDVKYVWELNRLQYLQPAAAVAAHDGNEALAGFCLSEIETWIEANPPFLGVNWASGIELALRVVSILVVLGFIGPERVPQALRRKIRSCLAAHAYWLARYPSRHSSANNHLVAEAGALFLLGTLWPELGIFGEAEAARALLTQQVEHQFHADGVGAEQSPTYAAFTLEWYLLCLAVGERSGRPFAESVGERLAAAGTFLRAITDEGGHLPRIGDDDEGRVLATAPWPDANYASSVLGALAAFRNKPELAPPVVRPALRDLYFGPAAPGVGREGALHFSQGGYSVFRRTIAGRRTLMAMDHGPLGHLSIAAHGHADALAVWLHIDDQPVLVDAGTYLYHSGREWRDRLRGTALHNTLTLDERDQSRVAGPFNWGQRAKCNLIAWKGDGEETYVRAGHDGYLASHGLMHERHLVAHGRGFTLHDILRAASSEAETEPCPFVEISFLIHPDLDVRTDGANAIVLRGEEPLLRIVGGELGLEMFKGSTNPARGWYSDHFGSIRPAPQLVFHPSDASARRFAIEIEVLPRRAPRQGAAGRETEAPA